jgi:integrase/recombinase XerD
MSGYIERVAGEIAALLAREGLDYHQTKTVFRAARRKAGLRPPQARHENSQKPMATVRG